MKNSSFKIWEGQSPYNSQPISAIITNIYRNSRNPKTGNMSQLWMLSSNISPVMARFLIVGDSAVCGKCPFIPALAKSFRDSCYVARRAFQAPGNVFRFDMSLPIDLSEAIKNIKLNPRPIRFGAYGDPAMLPQDLFELLISAVQPSLNKRTHTAYTHQQDYPFSQWIKQYAMASTHNMVDTRKYWDLGWRTFRITAKPEADKHEIICPNFTNKVSCKNCCLCNGKILNDNRKSITIPKH